MLINKLLYKNEQLTTHFKYLVNYNIKTVKLQTMNTTY